MAETLGVSKSSLSRWRTEFGADSDQAFPGNGQRKERDEEMARLQKALREAQMENEILKKAVAILSISSGQASRGTSAEIPIHRGSPQGKSTCRLLKNAVLISDWGQDKAGKPMKVLSAEMQQIVGHFDGKISFQRSPTRWVLPEFIDKATRFVRSLK